MNLTLQIPPQPPTNINCVTSATSIDVTFTPTELGSSSIQYELQFAGPIPGSGTVTISATEYTRSPVSPNGNYSLVIRSIDKDVDLAGTNSLPITCKAMLGVPAKPIEVQAILDNYTVRIIWTEPMPAGILEGYHVVVGDAITEEGRTQCDDLWENPARFSNRQGDTITSRRITQFKANVTVWFAEVNFQENDIRDMQHNPEVLYCVRSYNDDHHSQWATGSNTALGLKVGALVVPGRREVENNCFKVYLIVVLVIAILAVLAAVAIAVILGIALCVRRDKCLSPTDNYNEGSGGHNTSKSSRRGLTDRFWKRTPQRFPSNASTRPMVFPEEDGINKIEDIQGTEMDSNSNHSKSSD